MIGTIWLGTVSNASATITSTGDEQNNCGNDKLSLKVFCQNVESEVQGSDNAIIVNATQPWVTEHKSTSAFIFSTPITLKSSYFISPSYIAMNATMVY